jgi:tRNA-modifying protein YgfZ
MIVSDPASLLAEGGAFADLSLWRKVAVSGTDTGPWLQDLVSADIGDLAAGQACRSLLLTPTGRIRAEFTVARTPEAWLLLQDPAQPRAIDDLLSLYVLSSDVVMEDRTDELALFAVPGRTEPLGATPALISSPSCLGGGKGIDVIGPAGDHEALSTALEHLFARAGNEAVQDWRVRAGIPRFGVDATEDDLPQEAGLADLVAFDKGCYLGQEAVARVRNLGHPRRLALFLEAPGSVSPGNEVRSGGQDVGTVTSAAPRDGGTVVIARIRWQAREGPFETASGVALVPAQASSPV